MKSTIAAAALALAFPGLALAIENTKPDDTPAFCQSDPRAGFEGDGSNYCAPTSISDGLMLLAGLGFPKLASEATDEAQTAMIKELAADMRTDPAQGTDPDRILTGLQQFVARKGYSFKRLEYAGWRPLTAANQALKVAPRPTLKWLRAAAVDPQCVEVFNVGWYKEGKESYTRQGGHWVAAVGIDDAPASLLVHNPSLPADEQYQKTEVQLTPLDQDFVATGGASDMAGLYEVEGPGLPHGASYSAVIDCAIVFSLRR